MKSIASSSTLALPRIRRFGLVLGLGAVLAACVTINVYFPAAIAERVADQFVQEVYGAPAPTGTPSANEPQSHRAAPAKLLVAVLNFVIPPAQAAPDFDASTPAIQSIKSSLQARHKSLEGYYQTGAIGMTQNGEVAVRDLAAVPLPQRNALRKLVADENAERAALYREIASANAHPEWEAEIRSIFAQRWIGNARPGWFYQDVSGNWVAK